MPSSKFDSPEVSEEIIYVDIDYGAWSLQLLIWCTIVITVRIVYQLGVLTALD